MDADDSPQTYADAMNSPNANEWKQAIEEEINSLQENDTFHYVTLSDLPKYPKPNILHYRWVFRIKRDANNQVERYKARLVAKGFTQKEGIDYHETFAPVVKYKSLRIILSLATIYDLELKQMDVITAFLNAKLEEDVYMHVPHGFDTKPGTVLKLNKSLYGTKQAPHMWNEHINDFILSMGFTRLGSDTCVYIKHTSTGKLIILSLFVDDIVDAYAHEDEQEWLVVKNLFMTKYKMKDLGDVNWILGMKLTRDRGTRTLTLDQSQYLQKVLERFNMQDCKPALTPDTSVKLSKANCPTTDAERLEMKDVPYESIVGSLLYASLGTRPDIAHAVNEISKFMKDPGQVHWIAA